MVKDEDDPQFSSSTATAQLPHTPTDILQEVLEKLAKVGGYEDTDFGEIMGSQIAEDKCIVGGESARDQKVGDRKCNDSGDSNSHQMAPALSVPQIVQVSLYDAKSIFF